MLDVLARLTTHRAWWVLAAWTLLLAVTFPAWRDALLVPLAPEAVPAEVYGAPPGADGGPLGADGAGRVPAVGDGVG
ncbi:hypothetical protein ABGB17_34130, partial [Sphaerisporangium sp. B11E5]|uniref:hypothetical protein n=1 Tax=Sphaerisporangium sp. B11E5 TaxID=3153563 RepID=UPI00325DE6FA